MSTERQHLNVDREPGRLEQRRDRILKEAEALFLQHGYAGASVNEVVRRAGGSLATLYGEFGSKENLFAEAISFETEATALLDRDLDHLGEHLVRTLLDLHDRASSDPFLRAVMAAFRPNGTHFSATFQKHFTEPLAARLTGPDVPLRIAMICAYLVGLGAVRVAVKLPGVTGLSVEETVATFGPLLQDLITTRAAGRCP